MPAVIPHITFKGNCADAIEFYKLALGATVLFSRTFGQSPMAGKAPAENIIHCSIQVEDSVVMMCDDPNPDALGGPGNVCLTLGFNNVQKAREVFADLAAHGTVVVPLEKTFWAQAYGVVVDPFGVQWMVNCDAPK